MSSGASVVCGVIVAAMGYLRGGVFFDCRALALLNA